MPLLHFRRTFVEKMFAIHAKVEIYKETGKPIGSYARHYYDLTCLGKQEEVQLMLRSAEYSSIKEDYERVSLSAFGKGYYRPTDMRFANSDALFPPSSLHETLGKEYDRQCSVLCYDEYPSWQAVLQLFEQLREVF